MLVDDRPHIPPPVLLIDGAPRSRYEAAITIREDHTHTHILRWDSGATLGSGS
ncbi:hypothetical protein ACGFIW_03475 [Micromonospora sp. NPDC048935]|uniref:hypothetical protein n=1 Tax=Micromonospora sp. NPDC048935 TaxID=3364262 RepID=UPI003716D066